MEQKTTHTKERTRANEHLLGMMTPEQRLEDRRLFVQNLGDVLSQTRENIAGLELEDEDTLYIVFTNGYKRHVNIAMDSYMGIVKDVVKQGLC